MSPTNRRGGTYIAVGRVAHGMTSVPPAHSEKGHPPPCPGRGEYRARCVVSNACGSTITQAAAITVCACLHCVADFNQDGGVDGGDVEAFFVAWEASHCDADVNADGGVDGSDCTGSA
jgi:hypothetical protein